MLAKNYKEEAEKRWVLKQWIWFEQDVSKKIEQTMDFKLIKKLRI